MIENPKVFEKYNSKKPNCNRDCMHCQNSVYIQGLNGDIYQMCRFELVVIRNNINEYLNKEKRNNE